MRFPNDDEFSKLEDEQPEILNKLIYPKGEFWKRYLRYIKSEISKRKHNAEVIRRDIRKAIKAKEFSKEHVRSIIESVFEEEI